MTGGELRDGSVGPYLGGQGELPRSSRWRGRRGRAGCLVRRPDDSERGNHPRAFRARLPARGAGRDRRDACRRRGWGGAAVVLRARESRVHGEGRQRVSQGGNVMSEDAPVNTGAVEWLHPEWAHFAVRRMQAKLHRWAGEDPSRCFGDLFNLVYDPAFLVCAFERVAANAGAKTAGIDGVTVAQIKAREGGELEFLARLRDSLKSGGYRPVEVRQVMIPKGKSGKFRKLGIPTVTDRVVQASLKAVLEPIFEADFKPCSYGFRPNRRSQDAIAEIHQLSSGRSDYHWILEADIKACFDEIEHTALMGRLRVRIKDKRICGLVKAFLKSGIFTELGDQEESLSGTPQGGLCSAEHRPPYAQYRI